MWCQRCTFGVRDTAAGHSSGSQIPVLRPSRHMQDGSSALREVWGGRVTQVGQRAGVICGQKHLGMSMAQGENTLV